MPNRALVTEYRDQEMAMKAHLMEMIDNRLAVWEEVQRCVREDRIEEIDFRLADVEKAVRMLGGIIALRQARRMAAYKATLSDNRDVRAALI
jgi:hypothetical protein